MKNGSERVIQVTRDHLYDLRALEHYQHTDEKVFQGGVPDKLSVITLRHSDYIETGDTGNTAALLAPIVVETLSPLKTLHVWH